MVSKLEFPEKSVELAREIANRYKRREKSKYQLAANLYEGHFLEINYGFSEALKKGNCGPYLNEIIKESDCFSKAASYYLVAKELGLNPKFYFASDMKDLDEGEHASEKGTMDHSFITVKTKKGIEQIIDPFMSAWGKAKFSSKINEIKIYDRSKKRIKTRKYAALIEMSEQEILEKIEQNRSKEGGKLVLSGSQKIKSHGNNLHIEFNSETNKLSVKLPFSVSMPFDEPYKKSDIYKLETIVNEDGTFDLSKGDFIFYYAGAWGWSHHVDEQEPLIIPTSIAEISWSLFDKIMAKNNKRKNINKMGSNRLIADLMNLGLNYDFSTRQESIAQSIAKTEFSRQIKYLKQHQTMSVSDFLERARKDNITWKVFLREAQYMKARNTRISKKNPFGYVYSSDEHERLLLNYFEGYKQHVYSLTDKIIESTRIKAGLKNGSDFKTDRLVNQAETLFKNEVKFFKSLVDLRKIRNDSYAYPMKADETLFFEQFDLREDSISKLESGLSSKDLVEAGKYLLFEALLVGASRRKSLVAKAFHSGLRKILNRTQ